MPHQKKRNTGLLYEFLISYVSKQLVEGNREKYALGIKILKKNFRPDSELVNELKLIRSLVKTTVSSPAVAADIIFEARRAVRACDSAKLDREKSILIKNINYNLNEDNCFYDPEVKNYKLLATIQTLFNSWRDEKADLGVSAVYADKVVEHLVTEKVQEPATSQLHEESPGTTRLLMKMMTQKINEKYSDTLNNDQKSLIRSFAFSSIGDDLSSVKKKLQEIKENLAKKIGDYEKLTESSLLKQKLASSREKILSENIENINEDTVVRFMTYLKLGEELMEEDEKI